LIKDGLWNDNDIPIEQEVLVEALDYLILPSNDACGFGNKLWDYWCYSYVLDDW